MVHESLVSVRAEGWPREGPISPERALKKHLSQLETWPITLHVYRLAGPYPTGEVSGDALQYAFTHLEAAPARHVGEAPLHHGPRPRNSILKTPTMKPAGGWDAVFPESVVRLAYRGSGPALELFLVESDLQALSFRLISLDMARRSLAIQEEERRHPAHRPSEPPYRRHPAASTTCSCLEPEG